jgi:hypothetical protein
MLVLDHLRENAGILHLDCFDAGKIVALTKASDEALGLVGAERPLEDPCT